MYSDKEMEDNMAEISEDKIKSIDYLFNRIISERVRDSMEPKYSLLMGAGCSVSSQIVSAKDIINMLKTIFKGTSDRRYTNTIFGFRVWKISSVSQKMV